LDKDNIVSLWDTEAKAELLDARNRLNAIPHTESQLRAKQEKIKKQSAIIVDLQNEAQKSTYTLNALRMELKSKQLSELRYCESSFFTKLWWAFTYHAQKFLRI